MENFDYSRGSNCNAYATPINVLINQREIYLLRKMFNHHTNIINHD